MPAGFLAKALFRLAERLALRPQDKLRANARQTVRQPLPGNSLPARPLLHATEQAGLQVVEELQPIIQPAARMDTRKTLRELR